MWSARLWTPDGPDLCLRVAGLSCFDGMPYSATVPGIVAPCLQLVRPEAMKLAAALVVALATTGCRESAAAEQSAAIRADAGPVAATHAPPPPIPGKQVPGCVVPPPTPPETIAPRDEELYGTVTLAVVGQKPTREEARKLGREMAADVESLKLQPDPSYRLKICSKRLGDVIIANIKRPVDACIEVVDVCDPPRFGPGCCPKACLDEVKSYCAAHDCSPRNAATAINLTLFRGTCVPGLDLKP